ncbi:hypothetical protein N0V88_004761 [Collariella sp. IMI 366227]|nr:hypothetical protein N0V88_004761 [Collariella sp. IMI 366227]
MGMGGWGGVVAFEDDILAGNGELVVNTVPELAELKASELGWLSERWGAQVHRNILRLDQRLEYERKANFLLRWEAMERLETLALDLRGYSLPGTKYLHDEDIVRLAHSPKGKGSELLVIAGLRSLGGYSGPDAVGMEEVERGTWNAQRQMWVDERRPFVVKYTATVPPQHRNEHVSTVSISAIRAPSSTPKFQQQQYQLQQQFPQQEQPPQQGPVSRPRSTPRHQREPFSQQRQAVEPPSTPKLQQKQFH